MIIGYACKEKGLEVHRKNGKLELCVSDNKTGKLKHIGYINSVDSDKTFTDTLCTIVTAPTQEAVTGNIM